MINLRKSIGREEFDYLALMNALSGYANPRSKVTSLLAKRVIIRVKKGLYIFGEEHRLGLFSREYLANMIYGPSYVSLDYALSFYNLIPERVETVTSVCTKRPRSFDTPVGVFQYRFLHSRFYSVGFQRVEKGNTSWLIASPEKALLDKIKEDRRAAVRNLNDMRSYLFEDLRIEPETFYALDSQLMESLSAVFSSRKINLCLKVYMKGAR